MSILRRVKRRALLGPDREHQYLAAWADVDVKHAEGVFDIEEIFTRRIGRGWRPAQKKIAEAACVLGRIVLHVFDMHGFVELHQHKSSLSRLRLSLAVLRWPPAESFRYFAPERAGNLLRPGALKWVRRRWVRNRYRSPGGIHGGGDVAKESV